MHAQKGSNGLSPTSMGLRRMHKRSQSKLYDPKSLLELSEVQPVIKKRKHEQRMRLKSLLQTSDNMMPLLSLPQQSLDSPNHHPSVSFQPSPRMMPLA